MLVTDPAGVYAQMDFVTRDRCRHAVERIAASSPCSELEVARLVVAFAQEAMPADDTDQRRAHRASVCLPEPRAALDIGEQQRDGAGRAVRHRSGAATERGRRMIRARVVHAVLQCAPMDGPAPPRALAAADLAALLSVTRALAAPFDLRAMLGEVVSAAKQVLHADRGSVWLYDAATDELVLEVATGIAPVRVPSGRGLVGACAHQRAIINVPDCYADARFDSRVDRESGYHTRCMLTLPLVDHRDELVGVMQVLNKADGVFDDYDEALASALAAQCAVALQRARMTDAIIEGEKMRQALEMARVVQMSTLPTVMPSVPGYDIHGTFIPAELTGGDAFDLALVGERLLVVLADATGHGIAPALSVTQMQAMLRMAFRLGADLDTVFRQVNNRLSETLAADRFITAFVGVLDPTTHRLAFHSGGQGPILVYRAATGSWERHRPTSFPMGAMAVDTVRPAMTLALEPGDIVLLASDGIPEYENGEGEQFGDERVCATVASHGGEPAAAIIDALLAAVRSFAGSAPQDDDMTAVVVRREGTSAATAGDEGRIIRRTFERTFDALAQMVDFTAESFDRLAIDPRHLPTADLVIEELFTNMVKYGTGSAMPVELGFEPSLDGVRIVLVDRDVDPFDIRSSREVDIHAPIDERVPGGLGLHLIRRMASSIDYDYDPERRESRIAVWLAGKQ